MRIMHGESVIIVRLVRCLTSRSSVFYIAAVSRFGQLAYPYGKPSTVLAYFAVKQAFWRKSRRGADWLISSYGCYAFYT